MKLEHHMTELHDPDNPDEAIEQISPVIRIVEAEPYALFIDLGTDADAIGARELTGPRIWIERRLYGWALLIHDGGNDGALRWIVHSRDDRPELSLEQGD